MVPNVARSWSLDLNLIALRRCGSRPPHLESYVRLTRKSLISSSFFSQDRERRRQRSMDGNCNGAAPAAWDKAMERILWSPEDLDKRVGELADAISEDFSGDSLVVVGVATGAFMFLADLVRKINLPVSVDLIRVHSYGAKTESSGVANLTTDIRIDVKGRHVLLVEDIIDTGITLSAVVAHFATKGVASFSVCTLLDKIARRKVTVQLGAGGKYYRGFECPDEFVVGYGMDYAEEYRNLPYVGVLKPDVYAQT
ncbi:unnamed protein product [Calypogeia fissa]